MFALILTLLSLFILLTTFICWQEYKILKLEEYKIDIMVADRLENMINNNSQKLERFIINDSQKLERLIKNRLHGVNGLDVGDINMIDIIKN